MHHDITCRENGVDLERDNILHSWILEPPQTYIMLLALYVASQTTTILLP
jgi:hypothetical protein